MKTKTAWGIKTKRGVLVNQAFSCRSDAEQLFDPALGDKLVRVEIREVVKEVASKKRDIRDRRGRRSENPPGWLSGSVISSEKRTAGRRKRDP